MSKLRNLDPEQIDALSVILHTHMQFYDSAGKNANARVLDEVEKVLAEHPLTEGEP